MSEQYEFNGVVVGNISIDSDGVATGFGTNNYLLSPNVLKDATTSFEIVTAVELHSVGTILDNYFFGPSGIMLRVSGGFHETKLQLCIYTDGSTTTELIYASIPYASNTKIFFKISYNSSTGYVVSNSSDGETWTAVGSSAITSKPYSGVEYLQWGLASDKTYPVAKMYLGDTSIFVNGSKAWEALRSVSGSVQISKGYYATASGKIFFPYQKLGLVSLSDGETVGCKNKIFAFSKDGAASARITAQANNDITTAHDVSVDLNHPIYLNSTKNFIAGDTTAEPSFSFENASLEANYTVVGSPTVSSDHVASGFSSSNYIKADSLSSYSNFEYTTVVTITSTSGTQVIESNDRSSAYSMARLNGSTFGIHPPNQGWTTTGNATATVGNSYWLKCVYDSSTLKLYVTDFVEGVEPSSDLTTWTLASNVTNSTDITGYGEYFTYDTFFGFNKGYGEAFGGSVDLKYTDLKVNGVVVWSAVVDVAAHIKASKALVYDSTNDKTFWYKSQTSLALSDFSDLADRCNIYYVNQSGVDTSILDAGTAAPSGVDSSLKGSSFVYLNSAHDKILGVQSVPGEIVLDTATAPVTSNFTITGSPTITSDYIATFSSGSLIKPDTQWTYSGSPWAVELKFTTPAAYASGNGVCLFRWGNTDCMIFLNRGGYIVGCGWNGSPNVPVSLNTTYWLKVEYDGTNINMYLSTTGEYPATPTASSSSPSYWPGNNVSTSLGAKSAGSETFNGSIDLKEVRWYSNGTKVWEAITIADPTGIAVSPTDYWTFLGHTSYDAQGASLDASSMSATALTGHIMVGTNGTLNYSEGNAQFVAGLLPGQAYTGYDVTFTDNTHTAIASCDKVGERRRVYRSAGTNPEVVIDYVVMSLEDYEAGFEGGSLPYASESYSLLASDPIEYTSTETFVVSTEAPSVIGTPYYNPETDTFYVYHTGLWTGYQALTCSGEANIIDSTGV